MHVSFSGVPEQQLSWSDVLTRVGLGALGGVLVAVSYPRADLDVGHVTLPQLQLIGDADHVLSSDTLTHRVGDALAQAYWWDLALTIGYVLLLVCVVDLCCRGYRLRVFRSSLRGAALVGVVGAGALDVVETLLMRWQFAHPPIGGRVDDLIWPVIAATNWAKLFVLFAAIVVALGGVASYLSTPRWLRTAIVTTPEPDHVHSAALQGHEDGDREHAGLGIALSGGGVRSASIALGALQELERPGPDIVGDCPDLGWDAADHVTAVSGGAYMGGAFSVARNRPPGDGLGAGSPQAWRRTEGQLGPEERHLLNNLGYLTARMPRGHSSAEDRAESRATTASGNTRAGYRRASAKATVLAGLTANMAVLVAALGALILPYGWLVQWLEVPNIEDANRALSALVHRQNIVQPGLIWLGVGLGLTFGWVLVSKVPGLRGYPKLLTSLEMGSRVALGLGVVFLLTLVGIPWLAGHLPTSVNGALGAVVAAATALVAQARLLVKPAARYANKIGGIAFGAMLVIVVALWTRVAFQNAPDLRTAVRWNPQVDTALAIWLVLVGLLLLVWLVVSPESWSLAAFYRGKLRMAYATMRRPQGAATSLVNDSDADPDAGLHQEPDLQAFVSRCSVDGGADEEAMATRAAATPLTVCAASTITTRAVRTHYGIPALSVTFSPDKVRVFVPQDGQDTFTTLECDTAAMHQAYASKWWKPRGRLTTMFAVGVSGAAVSPAMGRFRIGPTSMLLTFANVRLGVWLPNPRYVAGAGPGDGKRSFPKARLGYLFKEFFGIHDPTDAFLYVTDGGHWENTGLVELLRLADYDEIVCVDADQGPADRVKALAQAVDLAKLEVDVDINVDLDALRAERSVGGGPTYASRSVTLGLVHSRGHTGLLWYAKPALTRDMPSQLLAHREVRLDFPRASTLNQFFDTSTFFAYRDLGRYNATEILKARAKLRRELQAHLTFESFAEVMRQVAETATEGRWVSAQLFDCLLREPPGLRETRFLGVLAALNLPDPVEEEAGAGDEPGDVARAQAQVVGPRTERVTARRGV